MPREITTFAYNESFIINQLKIHLLNILYEKKPSCGHEIHESYFAKEFATEY